MQIVLLVAGVITIVALQQWGTGIVLLGLTLFNAMMGLSQEGKAEASVAALQKMLIVKTRLRRDGQVVQLPAEEIVPGDIVLLEAGDRVPADGRLLRAATLEIDESALTGESVPVPKQIEAVPGADTPLGDRVDMAYMNTNVTRGTAELLVTATGMSTEVGHISGMLQETEIEKTPLTIQLDALTKQIIVIAMVALAVSIVIGLARGQTLDVLFLTAVAFAIAAIPTGLPAVVTFLLATGTTTLAAAHAIVKRLRSVETLGATSAINSDKTGTLTLNQMTAVEMSLVGQRLTVSGEGYSTVGQITHVGGLVEVRPRAVSATNGAGFRRRRTRRCVGRRSDRRRAGRSGGQGRHRRRRNAQGVPTRCRSALRRRLQTHGDIPRDDRRRRPPRDPLLRQGRAGPAPGAGGQRTDGRRQAGVGRHRPRALLAIQHPTGAKGFARHGPRQT